MMCKECESDVVQFLDKVNVANAVDKEWSA
jgi:hypothetical protein